ncbi:hypothetical protein OHA01_10805 [Micromonospora zamorensis]|uniref:hypothetical protein n=1 Tax=Micromonospora zamorensis TaxID=709883 RepID=UPI0038694E7B|nr:hypothetical protein OHA01_10805 [Micromonospora zamorensis]
MWDARLANTVRHLTIGAPGGALAETSGDQIATRRHLSRPSMIRYILRIVDLFGFP